MTDRDHPRNQRGENGERSSDDIRQDIAEGGDTISQTVEQISERIREKLEWRGYVKDSPYLALGVAAGLGYLASGVVQPRTTPLERISRSITRELRKSISGLLVGVAGPGLIKVTLLGIASKVAANWLKNAMSPPEASSEVEPPARQEVV